MAKFVDIKDVPLMRVGTWDASSGKEPVTRADLDAMVDAFNSGDLDPAVIKIGHVDPRFNSAEFDGNPAYGRVVNLRVSDDKGGTLIGDYHAVPEELAESIDSAYPYRSVEIAKNVELSDAEGNVVATHPVVLMGCALLGATPPAVKGLGPVHIEMSGKLHPSTTHVFSMGQFALQGGLTTNQLRQAIQSALYENSGPLASPNDDAWLEDFDDTLAWYHRDGGMWQSTYTVDAAGVVGLTGEPVAVKERRIFEPVPSDTTNNFPQAFAASPQSETEHPAGVPEQRTETAVTMAFTEKQLTVSRKLLGLPADADEAAVLAALEAREVEDAHTGAAVGTGTPAAGTTPGDGTGAQPTIPAGLPAAPAAAPQVAEERELIHASAAPTETVNVSAAQFAEFTAKAAENARELAGIRAERDKDRRDGIVRAAFSSGKLHPTEVDPWRKALDDNEAHTVALLNSRVAVFSTVEIGHDTAPAAFSLTSGTVDKVYESDDAFFNTNSGTGE